MSRGESIMFTIFKQKIFYRYLLSYFVAFIIPFSLLGAFVYVNFIADLQEELEQASLNNLQQVSESIGDRKREFTNIATRISTDTRLTSYQLNHPYYSYEAIKELGKYRSNSILFDEIALVYHENPDEIFTSRGYHSPENFISRYEITNLTAEKLSILMKEETPKAKVIETREGREFLAIIQPIMPNSLFPHGSVTYMIEKKHFVSAMSTALSDLVGHTYILDGEHQVLAAYMNDDNFSTAMLDFDEVLAKANNGETITIEGNNYALNLVEGNDGWSYVSVLQEGQLFGLFKGTLTSYLLMLLLVFLVGVIITYILSKHQYKPIDLLVKQVKPNQRQSHQEVNELRQVMHAFEQLNHDKATLSKTLYKHRPFAQQQFWMHLLKGEYPTKDAMSEMASSLQLELDKAYYFVVILHSDSEGIKTFKQQVENHLNYKNMQGYAVDLLKMNDKALIVGMDEKNKEEQSAYIQRIKKLMKVEPTVVSGTIVESVYQVHTSYLEAMVAYSYMSYYTAGSTIFFDEITTSTEESLGYLKEEQLKLLQAIKQGQQTIAKDTLTIIFKNLRERERSLNALKAVCFDVINSVVRTLSELGVPLEESTFNQLVDFVTLDQLEHHLAQLVTSTCEVVQERMANDNNRMVQEIIQYIQIHYKDYDLSLESIAEKYHISASYASKLIKEHYELSFKQYVQDLRMAYVKEQLTMTTKPIKAIVHDVGYKDVANFTRKFKKEVGVTPGQYRKSN